MEGIVYKGAIKKSPLLWEFFLVLLIFQPFQPVGTFLLRFVFTGYVDGILFLIKRIDFMGHKVGNVFFIEFDGADGAVFLLNTEKGFFHAEGGDGAGEESDLAGPLAALYIVLECFGDGAVSLWRMVKVLLVGWRVQVMSRERLSLPMSL